MKCTQAKLLVHGALDSAVSSDERARLYAHLTACTSCVAYAKVFNSLKKRLSAMKISPGQGVETVLERRIASERPGGLGRRFDGVHSKRHELY